MSSAKEPIQPTNLELIDNPESSCYYCNIHNNQLNQDTEFMFQLIPPKKYTHPISEYKHYTPEETGTGGSMDIMKYVGMETKVEPAVNACTNCFKKEHPKIWEALMLDHQIHLEANELKDELMKLMMEAYHSRRRREEQEQEQEREIQQQQIDRLQLIEESYQKTRPDKNRLSLEQLEQNIRYKKWLDNVWLDRTLNGVDKMKLYRRTSVRCQKLTR